MTEWFFKLTMCIYKHKVLGDSFLLSPTTDDEIQNTDKQIKHQRRTVHIYHELVSACVYYDREKTDNFSVDVIYLRFKIVYTCGIQSVSTVNRSRQIPVCVWLSTMCVSNCLSVCPCVCVTVCVLFRIIIMCVQIVHVCLHNSVHYTLLGSGVLSYVLSL